MHITSVVLMKSSHFLEKSTNWKNSYDLWELFFCLVVASFLCWRSYLSVSFLILHKYLSANNNDGLIVLNRSLTFECMLSLWVVLCRKSGKFVRLQFSSKFQIAKRKFPHQNERKINVLKDFSWKLSHQHIIHNARMSKISTFFHKIY